VFVPIGLAEPPQNSLPRSEDSSSTRFKSVLKTPGAIALTFTPPFAHSIASDLVRLATAAFDAEYAATSKSETKVESEAILMIRP